MAWLEHSPDVVFTELQDGAVLLAMDRGLYFSLDDVGLEIWKTLPAAASLDEVGAMLARRFVVEPGAATEAAGGFVARLEAETLVRPATGDQPAAPAATPADDAARRPFAEPRLVQHDEPLHEVPASPFDPQLPLAE